MVCVILVVKEMYVMCVCCTMCVVRNACGSYCVMSTCVSQWVRRNIGGAIVAPCVVRNAGCALRVMCGAGVLRVMRAMRVRRVMRVVRVASGVQRCLIRAMLRDVCTYV